MTCFTPLDAWKASSPNLSGKTSLVFNPSKAAQPDAALKIACGQCIGCRLKRAQDWAIRLSNEAKYHEENIFITMTFDEYHLSIRDNPGSVEVRDVQLFIKRLRKNTKRKVRYYAVGEYGEATGRPHYHILLFGWKPTDGLLWKTTKKKSRLYNSEQLSELWPFGHINYGNVTWDSASYCAGYITKKFGNVQTPERLKWVDPLTGQPRPKNPEFSTCSRDPSIGQQWIEDHYKDAYKDDYIIVKGKKRSLPRSYDEWMEKHHPEWMAQIKSNRELEFRELPHITEDRRLDMHLCRWHTHTQRIREARNDSTDIHDLRQQSQSIPKAILHAQRRYSYQDAD